ncbi:MAG: M48 family metallopeptidase [Clostridiaceae bacterium]|jgi:predicted metal-dependent hydrolase|nr:M48 family metallopeptidase [Clostridiaceae bacterium]
MNDEKIIGATVTHGKYGRGHIAEFDKKNKHITVDFSAGDVRKFPFPQAFSDGYLKTDDKDFLSAVSRAEKDAIDGKAQEEAIKQIEKENQEAERNRQKEEAEVASKCREGEFQGDKDEFRLRLKSSEKVHTVAGVEYTIVREARYREMKLRVIGGKVVVTAPFAGKNQEQVESEAEAAVKKSVKWLEVRLATAAELQATEKPPEVCLTLNEVRRLFTEIRELYGAEYADIRIGFEDRLSAWGRCFPKERRIMLNVEIVIFPKHIVEYVICHEFAHFKVSGHGDDFYAEVSKVITDAKAVDREQNRYERLLSAHGMNPLQNKRVRR